MSNLYTACPFQNISDKSLEVVRILLTNLKSRIKISVHEADAMKLTLDIIDGEQVSRGDSHKCYQPDGENE